MAWAGIYNTFFWIDPARKTTAVLMMQLLPFLDDAAKDVLEEFELAVYGSAPRTNQRGSAAVCQHRRQNELADVPLTWLRETALIYSL